MGTPEALTTSRLGNECAENVIESEGITAFHLFSAISIVQGAMLANACCNHFQPEEVGGRLLIRIGSSQIVVASKLRHEPDEVDSALCTGRAGHRFDARVSDARSLPGASKRSVTSVDPGGWYQLLIHSQSSATLCNAVLRGSSGETDPFHPRLSISASRQHLWRICEGFASTIQL